MNYSGSMIEKCPECKSNRGGIYKLEDREVYFVECHECGYKTIMCDSVETAIAFWNDTSIINNEWLEKEDE